MLCGEERPECCGTAVRPAEAQIAGDGSRQACGRQRPQAIGGVEKQERGASAYRCSPLLFRSCSAEVSRAFVGDEGRRHRQR